MKGAFYGYLLEIVKALEAWHQMDRANYEEKPGSFSPSIAALQNMDRLAKVFQEITPLEIDMRFYSPYNKK